jgi:ACS family allantoate permease-like MFS transporter
MYGIGLATDVKLTNWRIMFLVCGGATILMGVAFIFLMPQGPETAWFLTDEEKKIASQRLLVDGITQEKKQFKKSQLMEALTDPLSWLAISFGFLGTFASPVLKVRELSQVLTHRV